MSNFSKDLSAKIDNSIKDFDFVQKNLEIKLREKFSNSLYSIIKEAQKETKETFTISEQELEQAKAKLYSCACEAAERFAPIFEKMGWTWAGYASNNYQSFVPKQLDIECVINSLIKDLYPGDPMSSVSTGRISVTVVKDDSGALSCRIYLTPEWISEIVYPDKEEN